MGRNLRKYEVQVDRVFPDGVAAVKGDIVYEQTGHDYGLASDDTRFTGIEHITVTLNKDGGYPGFTIAKRDLKEIP